MQFAECVVSWMYFYTFRWGDIDFPLPFGRVLNPTESFIHSLDEKVVAYVSSCLYLNSSKCLQPKTEFNHGNWNFPFNSIGEMNKSYSRVDTADKCIFEIHGVEPKRTHLDNGSWRWCKCYIC
jgi:hypothetical protein